MVRVAVQAMKTPALQLRCSELRDTDIAGKQPVIGSDLEGVTINQLDQCLGRNHRIAWINIPNDMTSGVNRLKGAS